MKHRVSLIGADLLRNAEIMIGVAGWIDAQKIQRCGIINSFGNDVVRPPVYFHRLGRRTHADVVASLMQKERDATFMSRGMRRLPSPPGLFMPPRGFWFEKEEDFIFVRLKWLDS